MAFQPAIRLLLQAHNIIHESHASVKSGLGKSSHNELERGRRAHLRGCMDQLKSQLIHVTPGTRLTTLVILKAAKEQIQESRSKNNQHKQMLLYRQKEYNEANERYRLMNLEMEKLKTQIRRKRRSGSECSVATTLSDDSEQHRHSTKKIKLLHPSSCSSSNNNNNTVTIKQQQQHVNNFKQHQQAQQQQLEHVAERGSLLMSRDLAL